MAEYVKKASNLSLGRHKAIIKLISKQLDVLKAAGADLNVLQDYAALVSYLRNLSSDELDRILSRPGRKRAAERISDDPGDSIEVKGLSLGALVKLIEDERTPRSTLEHIAVHRFDVPRGSMQRYSNRRMLIEKLMTLIRNEQAHETIEAVAKASSRTSNN